MKPRNQGIPTIYNGVQFRSRLEARWACFFDLIGWTWEYEPLDLNGWIPDFRLTSDDGHHYLVEIKPHRELCPDTVKKIESAAPSDVDVWILADGLLPAPLSCQSLIGWSMEAQWAPLVLWEEPMSGIHRVSWLSDGSGSMPRGQMCNGAVFPVRDESTWMKVNTGETVRLWKAAGNAVQWKGAQNHG
jgi:hypothetical protein